MGKELLWATLWNLLKAPGLFWSLQKKRTYKLPGILDISLLLSNTQTWESKGEKGVLYSLNLWNGTYYPPSPIAGEGAQLWSRREAALSPPEQTLSAVTCPQCKPEDTWLWDFWQPHFWPRVEGIKIIIPSTPKMLFPFSQTLAALRGDRAPFPKHTLSAITCHLKEHAALLKCG